MKNVIAQQGIDYRAYSEDSKKVVFGSVKYAQLIKAMIDTAILDADGNLVLSTEKRIKDVAAVAGGQKAGLDTTAA